MEKKTADTYYNSYFKKVNNLSEQGLKKSARFYRSIYRNFLPINKNLVILDLGCGTGNFLYFLEREGYKNYYGIDVSKEQIEFCNSRITKKVEVADAFEFLSGKKNVFDVIVANDVLEHISKNRLFEILDLAKNSLKSDGIVLIKVPNMSNPFSLMNRYKDMTHETGFTESSLFQALEAGGFQNVEVKGANYPVVSIETFIGKMLEQVIYIILRIMFRIQGHSVPKFLNKDVIAKASKKS